MRRTRSKISEGVRSRACERNGRSTCFEELMPFQAPHVTDSPGQHALKKPVLFRVVHATKDVGLAHAYKKLMVFLARMRRIGWATCVFDEADCCSRWRMRHLAGACMHAPVTRHMWRVIPAGTCAGRLGGACTSQVGVACDPNTPDHRVSNPANMAQACGRVRRLRPGDARAVRQARPPRRQS